MSHNDDEFRASVYWGLVLRIPADLRQAVLNFLENQRVRILFQTRDYSPLRIVRTGDPQKFWEVTKR